MFNFLNRLAKKYSKELFSIGILVVVIISCFFRFWNYLNRWGLAYDQAQFATVARYAHETSQIPLLGPFSSGGPFQTGGEWYWIVMMGTIIAPNFLLSPWVFNSLLTVLGVVIMILVGTIYKDKTLGIILGLLIAFSPAQIYQSTNLTNQTPIALFSALSLLFVLLYSRQKKALFIFLAALSVGFASAVHIQSIALIPFLFFTLILFRKRIIKSIIFVLAGLAIPWIPVLIADFQNNFYNTTAMLTYFSNDQAKTSYDVLGRRWLTFLTEFIPNVWGQISGGNIVAGFILIIISGILFGYKFVKKKISKEVFLIFISLAAMFVIMRYIRTPLFESFYVFIHPFVIFITGWVIYFIYKKNKILGFFSLSLVLLFSFISFWQPINNSTNNTFTQVSELKNILYERYPNEKFSIYDYDSNNTSTSMSLVLVLYLDNRTSNEGKKIGAYRLTKDSSFVFDTPPLYGYFGGLQLYDISASESSRLVELGWDNQDPETVYNRTQFWFKDDK